MSNVTFNNEALREKRESFAYAECPRGHVWYKASDLDDEALLRLSCPFGGGLFTRCGASLTIGYRGKGIAPKNSPVSYAQARQKLQELIPETTLGDFNDFWAEFQVDALLQLITAFGDEAATAALEQAAQMLAKGSDGVGGDWEASEAAAAITKPAAIGDDNEHGNRD